MDDGEEPKVRKLDFDDDSTAADSTAADSTPVTDEAMIDAIIANEAPAEDAEHAVDDEVLANQPSEEDAAKEAELQRWDEYGAYSIVSRESAESRPLSLVWVLETRSGELKARLCARPFGREPKSKDELYCPTPCPATVKLLLVLAEKMVGLRDSSTSHVHYCTRPFEITSIWSRLRRCS